MRRFLDDHSLSLALTTIVAATLAWSLAVGAEAKDVVTNLFGDSWGAWLIVVFTKWLSERGKRPSKESK